MRCTCRMLIFIPRICLTTLSLTYHQTIASNSFKSRQEKRTPSHCLVAGARQRAKKKCKILQPQGSKLPCIRSKHSLKLCLTLLSHSVCRVLHMATAAETTKDCREHLSLNVDCRQNHSRSAFATSKVHEMKLMMCVSVGTCEQAGAYTRMHARFQDTGRHIRTDCTLHF